MAKILRFMSAEEAIRLIRGELLENRTDHRAAGNNSTSVGFCFVIAGAGETIPMIHEASKYLSGVVDMDMCLFATLKSTFHKTEGRYSAGSKQELCSTKYSLDDLKEWELYAPERLGSDVWRVFARNSSNWLAPTLVARSGATHA